MTKIPEYGTEADTLDQSKNGPWGLSLESAKRVLKMANEKIMSKNIMSTGYIIMDT